MNSISEGGRRGASGQKPSHICDFFRALRRTVKELAPNFAAFFVKRDNKFSSNTIASALKKSNIKIYLPRQKNLRSARERILTLFAVPRGSVAFLYGKLAYLIPTD